jgi:hypothetical protein
MGRPVPMACITDHRARLTPVMWQDMGFGPRNRSVDPTNIWEVAPVRVSSACVSIWCQYQRLVSVVRRFTDPLTDDRGDLSAYLAQGVLALAAVSLTGVVLTVFSSVGTHLSDIVNQWISVPIVTTTGG